MKQRIWWKYTLEKKKTKINSRLNFTFEILKVDKRNDDLLFSFDNFKKTHLISIYNFLIKKLHGRCLSIGSGKAHLEYHLSKKFKILPTDINKDFIKYNNKIKKFDIINCNSKDIKKLGKFNCIFIPNIEYLFNDTQLNKFFNNLKKIAKKNTDIYFCFRSRYTFVTNIIDHIICPIEIFLKKYIKFYKYKNFKIIKNHQGFKRKDKEIEKIIKKHFSIISIFRYMFSWEYKRSFFLSLFNLHKILKYVFFKSHPYLNIYYLKML
jgi:hypothetical protein